jgi:PHD/YefM family antitoxin component YafN of YafNO toxin-antitoxin module
MQQDNVIIYGRLKKKFVILDKEIFEKKMETINFITNKNKSKTVLLSTYLKL